MPLGPLDYFRVPLVGICCSCFSWLAPATQLGTLALGSRSHAMDTQSPGSPLAGFWLVVVLSQGRTKELKSPRGHRVQQAAPLHHFLGWETSGKGLHLSAKPNR